MSSPDKVLGPLIANLMRQLADNIQQESGARAVRVVCEMTYENKHGHLDIKTFVTPDAKTERLLDPEKPLPRGSKLQHDVVARLRSNFARLIEKLGG